MHFKKFISFFMVGILTLIALIPLAVQGASLGEGVVSTNTIVNGGFEKVFLNADSSETSKPIAWSLYGDAKSCTADGTKVLSASNGGASQKIDSLIGGQSYTVSMRIRSAQMPTRPRITLTWYKLSATGAEIEVTGSVMEWHSWDGGHETLVDVYNDNTASWHTFTEIVTAPANATLCIINLTCQLQTVYYDDITFTGYMYRAQANSAADADVPAAEGTTDLMNNGPMNTGLNGWGLRAGAGGYVAPVYETLRTYEGAGSALLVNNNLSQAPSLQTDIVGKLTGGSLYRLEARIATIMDDSVSYVAIKTEYYKTDSQNPGFNATTLISSNQCLALRNTNGVWNQVVVPVRVPEDCNGISIYFRLYGNGRTYVDDASFTLSSEKGDFELESDETFYYSDRSKPARFTFKKTDRYTGEEPYAVDFVLYEGTTPVSTSSKVTSKNENGDFYFDLPIAALGKEKTKYIMQAEAFVYQSGWVSLGKSSCEIYKNPRPEMMNENGEIIKDEQVFTPIFSYHHPTSAYSIAEAAGINTVQVSNAQQLAEAEKAGLMGLLVTYRDMKPAGHPDNAAYTRELVESVKDSPALLGYLVMDEPHYSFSEPQKWLVNSYCIIREIDDKHPIIVMESEPDYYISSAKVSDILAIDPYIGEQTAKKNTLVYEKTKAAIGEDKPVYTLLQTFLYKNYFPTGEDIRHQLYQAMFAGAKGVGYYCFENANNGQNLNELSIWNTLTSFGSEEAYYAKKILMQSGDEVLQGEQNGVFYAIGYEESTVTAIILNNSTQDKNGNITAKQIDGEQRIVKQIGGNGTYTANTLSYTVSAGEVAFLQFQGGNVDAELFKNGNFESLAKSNEAWQTESGALFVNTSADTQDSVCDYVYHETGAYDGGPWIEQNPVGAAYGSIKQKAGNISVTPDTWYVLSFWTWRDDTTDKDVRPLLEMEFIGKNQNGSFIPGTGFIGYHNKWVPGWSYCSMRIKTPSWCNKIQIKLGGEGRDGGLAPIGYADVSFKQDRQELFFAESAEILHESAMQGSNTVLTMTEGSATTIKVQSSAYMKKATVRPENGKLYAIAHYNSQYREKNAILITAIYTEKDGITEITSISLKKIETDDVITLKEEVILPEAQSGENYRAQIFLWKSENIQPLSCSEGINWTK